uniref:Small ribosomal subunit protein uS2c n=1 Tax=Atractomorpha echinata TaxID=52677 RepID=A0A140GIP6_9CHLO|nr:ribosomal protein S2 [Atractomorpha echinata]
MNTTSTKKHSRSTKGRNQTRQTYKNNVNELKTLVTKLQVGDILDVNITSLGFTKMGIAEFFNGYSILVPNVNVGDYVKVQIVKISSAKTKYAIAKLLEIIKHTENKLPIIIGEVLDLTIQTTGAANSGIITLPNNYKIIVPNTKPGDQVKIQISRVKKNYAFGKVLNFLNKTLSSEQPTTTTLLTDKLVTGSQLTVIIPNNTKFYGNHLVLKFREKFLLLKLSLGVQKGDKVRVKLTKLSSNFVIGKVININPLSENDKQSKIKNSIKTMLKHGMHYGEKAVKCHARMRKFIWIRKKGNNLNRPLIKKGRHLLNLLKTRRCLIKALQQLSKYALKGRTFLFVGTKKSASALIARAALLTKTSFFVNTRWLGGMLTNWKTILKSISKIKPLLKEKQKIIKNILEKRERIKLRLFKKVSLLRIKSQELIQKGKKLICKVKQNKEQFLNINKKLLNKREQLIQKGELLIQIYKNLITKNNNLTAKNLESTEKANQLIKRKKNLVKQLLTSKKQLRELQLFLLLSTELTKLKQIKSKQGKKLWTMAYGKLLNLTKQNNFRENLVPTPPKEVLNKMLITMRKTSEILTNNSSNLLINRSKTEGNNIILFSKLLNKFSDFTPFITNYMQIIKTRLTSITFILANLTENIKLVKKHITTYNDIQKKLVTNINFIKTKLLVERKVMHNLKLQLKKLASEQRLLRFLPKLRSLSKSTDKIAQTIQIVMKKFVDPKMVYPMDAIYDEKLKSKSNKLAAARKKKWQRLEKYFGGISKMAAMRQSNISNNVAIIIGQQEELNAVRECKKLGIKMFHIVDTNCNPLLADHIIPANDDSRNSIKFILNKMLKNIRLAQKIRNKLLIKQLRPSKKFV